MNCNLLGKFAGLLGTVVLKQTQAVFNLRIQHHAYKTGLLDVGKQTIRVSGFRKHHSNQLMASLRIRQQRLQAALIILAGKKANFNDGHTGGDDLIQLR